MSVTWGPGAHQLGGPSQRGGATLLWALGLLAGAAVAPGEASPVWAQIKVDICGRPVLTTRAAEPSLIARLQAEGRTIIFVSHNMVDVAQVATRVAILRAGRKVVDRRVAGLTPVDLSKMIMTGESGGG